jgi:hypothetical protein
MSSRSLHFYSKDGFGVATGFRDVEADEIQPRPTGVPIIALQLQIGAEGYLENCAGGRLLSRVVGIKCALMVSISTSGDALGEDTLNLISIRSKMKKTTITLNIDTATLGQIDDLDLNSVSEPERRMVIKRKEALQRDTRFQMVWKHFDRMKLIFTGLRDRTIEPHGDVYTTLRSVSRDVETVLKTWKKNAKIQPPLRSFEEGDLVREIKFKMSILDKHVADLDGKDAEETAKKLKDAREQVGDVLARAESGVRAWVKDANIKYRGSLATGWKNAKKSLDDNTAQRINLMQFDCDAFVELPNRVWEDWVNKSIIPPKSASAGKISLPDAIKYLKKLPTPQKESELERIQEQLQGIKMVEDQLKIAFGTVKGYKMKPSETGSGSGSQADFGFVLQPVDKSLKEIKAGNAYPLDQIARAGLPLTENLLELFYEDNTLKVRMPEKHISMSSRIETSTSEHPFAASPEPHTVSRDTPADTIKQREYERWRNKMGPDESFFV